MAATDPNPNIRSADRGGLNTIISGATASTGYAFTGNALPASSIAYARVPSHIGQVNPNAFFQVDVSAGTASGNFLASNDLAKWYSIGQWSEAANMYPLSLAAGYRWISASLDAIAGGGTVNISAVL